MNSDVTDGNEFEQWVLDDTPDYVVLNKPAGIAVQGEAGSLFQRLKAQVSGNALWPVHRLDKDTSGVVLFARTQQACVEFAQAFRDGQADKYYLAISASKPKKKQGSVVGDLHKARSGCYKLTRERTHPAKTAFLSASIRPGERLFFLRLHTGKTHQARVSLKSIGAPILGDRRYGGADADRMYLHAWSLALPFQGGVLRWTCLPTMGERFKLPQTQRLVEEFGAPALKSWPKVG